MVSISYWEKLTDEEKSEYRKHSSKFIHAVQASEARDGFEFTSMYMMRSKSGTYFMAKVDSDEPFAEIVSKSKRVIETLLADAGQNYGR